VCILTFRLTELLIHIATIIAETSGADLVVLVQHPRILVVRNFESVIHGYITFSEATLEIDFFYLSGTIPFAHKMAFRNGKVVLTTVSSH
jgi:hypothetical protein